MNRGEIWWADVPAAGRRPVLILTRDEAIPHLNTLVCAPVTRSIRSVPSELLLDEDDGMPAECVVSFDNVQVVAKRALRGRICVLGPERMSQVCPTLGTALGC